MYKPESIYTKISLEAIVKYIKEGETLNSEAEELQPELGYKFPCFVSIHTLDGALRGCVGTLEPCRDNLYQEIVQNSISAATKDSRFETLKEHELDDISVSVYVLSEPFPVYNLDDHNPITKGLIVKLNGITRAVLLPNIKGIDTVDDQVYKLKKKGGIEDIDNEHLEFYAFTAEEYK